MAHSKWLFQNGLYRMVSLKWQYMSNHIIQFFNDFFDNASATCRTLELSLDVKNVIIGILISSFWDLELHFKSNLIDSSNFKSLRLVYLCRLRSQLDIPTYSTYLLNHSIYLLFYQMSNTDDYYYSYMKCSLPIGNIMKFSLQ